MRGVAIALAGPIGAGKSTLAQELASRLYWPHVSFGARVRAEAERRGAAISREALERVGESLIQAGRREFTISVLEQAPRAVGQGIVIEGVRHQDAITTLQEVLNSLPVLSVYLDVSSDLARSRLEADGRDEKLHQALTSPMEAGSRALASVCDLRLAADRPVGELCDAVIAFVEMRVCD